jgi:hypothetical protein
MRPAALSLLLLSALTPAGSQSKAEKVKKFQANEKQRDAQSKPATVFDGSRGKFLPCNGNAVAAKEHRSTINHNESTDA